MGGHYPLRAPTGVCQRFYRSCFPRSDRPTIGVFRQMKSAQKPGFLKKPGFSVPHEDENRYTEFYKLFRRVTIRLFFAELLHFLIKKVDDKLLIVIQ